MISKRIKEIAKYTKDSYKIIDVGCDHGYLIIEALTNYNVKYALAVDNKSKPLDFAVNNIIKEGLIDRVKFYLSNGLDKLDDECDTIVISGLGGVLISNIINDNIRKINKQRLILQANRNNYELRKYLAENNFVFIDEEIIYEDFYYQIIVAKKNIEKIVLTESQLHYGPINIIKRSKLFLNMLKKEEEILNKIPDSNTSKKEKKEIIRSILNESKRCN